MRLRHKLFIAIALLISIPLLVMLFVVVERAEREVETRVEAELHGTLAKMEGELKLLINDQRSLARGLARVPALSQFATIAAHAPGPEYRHSAEALEQFFLNYQHAVPSIQALRFIDPNGLTLVKVKEGKPVPARRLDAERRRLFVADQSNKRFFKQAIASRQDVTMSDFELGQVTVDADFCPAMVRYTVKIRDELDTLLGFLVINMWGKQVDSTVEAALGGHPGQPYIVEINDAEPSRDGIFLYHPDTEFRFANQLGTEHRLSRQLSEEEWRYLKASEEGSIYRDNGQMLFFKKFLPAEGKPTQWVLIIETDADTVLAPIIHMRHSIWLLLGVLLFIGLMVARWSATRLARPVNELAGLIKSYADGNREVRFSGQGRDEIGTAGRAFNYLTETLERSERARDEAERAARQSERLAAVGQMAAGIGHEINNPLMNIMSLASLLEKELRDGDEQMHNDIELLLTEGRRCARIVQGILNFARSSTPARRQFDMQQLIEDTAVLMQHRLHTAQIDLEIEYRGDLEMEGDPNMLQQVLVNVLLNSIQASPEHSTISLHAWEEGEDIIVEISDDGPGINNANLSQVLDPFFTTKQEGEGTGLGLSVSYGIIKEHNGDIRLENREEGGVKVTIRIPRESTGQTGVEQADQSEDQGKVEAVNVG